MVRQPNALAGPGAHGNRPVRLTPDVRRLFWFASFGGAGFAGEWGGGWFCGRGWLLLRQFFAKSSFFRQSFAARVGIEPFLDGFAHGG